MKRFAWVPPLLVLTLMCSALSGCERVPPAVASAGAKILARVVPTEFVVLKIEEGAFGDGGRERCLAKVTPEHEQDWLAAPDRTIWTSGPRGRFDLMALDAVKNNGRWELLSTDADPESMDTTEFQTRVTECIDSLREARDKAREYSKQEADKAAHNRETWAAAR
ncbi:hypothetical protein DIE18_03195 [Burkholderia sp. Bp9125]|nr:hypothetical protein DIE18_03195 [Burkholderia sp. Bp9125]